MATATAIITAICPKLAASASLDMFIELATARTSSEYFLGNYTMAVALRACHMFTLSQRNLGESGPVTSKTEGRLSLSFGTIGATNMTDKNLSQTGYGIQLMELIAGQFPAIGVLGQNDVVDSASSPVDPYSNSQIPIPPVEI